MTVAPPWRRNVFAATCASFVGFMGFTLVMPFLPLYFQQLGVTDVGEIALWSGLSLGVTPAMTALFAPLWGRLADRFGLKVMVERSLASFVIVMASLGCVTEAWHVFALRALQGLFAGYGALTLTMAAQSAPKNRLAWAIGSVQTAQRLGPAIGPLIGGVIAPVVGLRRAFFVAAGVYAIAFLLVLVLYREPRIAREQRASAARDRVTVRIVLAFQNVVVLMVAIFAIQFADRSLGPILPLLVGDLGVTRRDIPLVSGLLFSAAAGSAALGNSLCGRLLERWSARALISGCAAVGGAAACLLAGASHVAYLAVATPVFGVTMGIAMTAAYTAAGSVIPAGAHGVGFGVLTSASLVGLALSPMVSGLLGAKSLRAVFMLDALMLAALAWLISRSMIDAPPSPLTVAEAAVAEEPPLS